MPLFLNPGRIKHARAAASVPSLKIVILALTYLSPRIQKRSREWQYTMDFGSDYVYAPKEQKEEYEYVPESVFNHTAAAINDDPSADDGEVCALFHAGLPT